MPKFGVRASSSNRSNQIGNIAGGSFIEKIPRPERFPAVARIGAEWKGDGPMGPWGCNFQKKPLRPQNEWHQCIERGRIVKLFAFFKNRPGGAVLRYRLFRGFENFESLFQFGVFRFERVVLVFQFLDGFDEVRGESGVIYRFHFFRGIVRRYEVGERRLELLRYYPRRLSFSVLPIEFDSAKF